MREPVVYYTCRAMAGLLGVSEQTVREWTRKGMRYRTRKEIGKKAYREVCMRDVKAYQKKRQSLAEVATRLDTD